MMVVSPVLVIKVVEDSTIGVRARLYDDFVEHEIVLNSVLAYWWANNLSAPIKFLELFESVIKRTINELIPHKILNIKYEVKANDNLEQASRIKINLISLDADGTRFKIESKELTLNGLTNSDHNDKYLFNETFEKKIKTPDIVFKKYMEMNK